MGKKSFVTDDYDPIGQALAVDRAKAAAPTPAPASPTSPPAAPNVAEQGWVPPSREAVTPRPEPVAEPSVGERGESDVLVPQQAPTLAVAPAQQRQAASALDDDEVSKRIKVSRGAFLDFEGMLARIHNQTGTQIPYSIATRMSWDLMTRAEAALLEELRRHPIGPLPSTKDRLAYAAFQERLLKAAATAYRKLPRSAFQAVAAIASDLDLDD